MPVGEPPMLPQDAGEALDQRLAAQRDCFGTVTLGQRACREAEQLAPPRVWISMDGRIKGTGSADEEADEAVVAFGEAPVALLGEGVEEVGAAAVGAPDLAGGHGAIPLEGGQVLADGHRGETEGGRKLIDGGTVIALEECEDFGLGGVQTRLF